MIPMERMKQINLAYALQDDETGVFGIYLRMLYLTLTLLRSKCFERGKQCCPCCARNTSSATLEQEWTMFGVAHVIQTSRALRAIS
jgi:hypothetical protein